MAHAFVTGAAPSDSERDITVGGVAQVGLATFAGVDYAALGHLHGRHTLAKGVRYSGSPLAYSFSEAAHRKGGWLVDLDADGLASVEFVDAPVHRGLRVLRGRLDELLATPTLHDAEDCYVQATLTDAQRPRGAMERLRARFPHTLVVGYEPEGARDTARVVGPRVLGRSDAEVLADFFTDVRTTPPTPEEAALLEAACDACRVAADEAS
jgi:exonuclease SbcD